jgi:hypothetical protein
MGDQMGKWAQQQGLPGGPSEYGKPDDLKFEDYARDPTKFNSGVDYDAIARQLKTQAALSGGNKMSQLGARYAGAGMRRADMGTGLNEIGADTERAQNDADLKMQQGKLNDQMSLMQAYNQAIDRANAMKKGKYDTDLKNYENEKAYKQAMLEKYKDRMHETGSKFMGAGLMSGGDSGMSYGEAYGKS